MKQRQKFVWVCNIRVLIVTYMWIKQGFINLRRMITYIDVSFDEQSGISLNGAVYDLSVNHSWFEKESMLNIHEYLVFKKFIGLLASVVSTSNLTKCVSINIQKCMTQPVLINLHPDEYSQELRYYSFTVNLDWCSGSCNTLDDPSSRVCVPNETEDLNLHVFNIITGIIESRTLAKRISCKCKFNFDSKKCNSNQKWNNGKCWCECKNPKEQCALQKNYICNTSPYSCENGKYVGSIIDNSVVIFDENMKETKTVSTKSTSKKAVRTKCASSNFYIWLAFLLITVALLIAVSIYCFFIKYQAK